GRLSKTPTTVANMGHRPGYVKHPPKCTRRRLAGRAEQLRCKRCSRGATLAAAAGQKVLYAQGVDGLGHPLVESRFACVRTRPGERDDECLAAVRSRRSSRAR